MRDLSPKAIRTFSIESDFAYHVLWKYFNIHTIKDLKFAIHHLTQIYQLLSAEELPDNFNESSIIEINPSFSSSARESFILDRLSTVHGIGSKEDLETAIQYLLALYALIKDEDPHAEIDDMRGYIKQSLQSRAQ